MKFRDECWIFTSLWKILCYFSVSIFLVCFFPSSAFHFVCVCVFFFLHRTDPKMYRKSLKFNHIHNISICIASRDTNRHNWLQLKQEFNRINSLQQFFSRVNCIHTKRIVFRNTQNGGLARCAPCISTNEGKKSILDGWWLHWYGATLDACVCASIHIQDVSYTCTSRWQQIFVFMNWMSETNVHSEV